jgi:beta-lactamase regulating signal transducer with metallopeptidase domain
MNSFIETLNQWGNNFLSFAWPMLWQSSLLIAGLLAVDFLFRRKLRASIRYALWLVVLIKLCVPPTLALPTSPVWWLHKTPPQVAAKAAPRYTVTYDKTPLPEILPAPLTAFVPPKPTLTNAALMLVASAAVSSVLLCWLLVRWWQITRHIRRSKTSERLAVLAGEAQTFIGTQFKVQVKLTTNSMSPAVCGLFRPAILIPQSLMEHFSDAQSRAVLLHELIHLRRRDVWLNFAQALLQIVYWWHPLIWLANARIRRVREEAVDDAVMLALRDAAEAYAPTLLEVAKLALNRPLVSLGLVGIMESRHSLRQRIERLVDFRPPRQAGQTLVSLLGILAFTAVAVPMGEGPSETNNSTFPEVRDNFDLTNSSVNVTGILTDPDFRVVLHALEQRNGYELLAEPEVVTTSGHSVNRIRTDNLSAPLFHPVSGSSNQIAMTFKLNHPIRQDEFMEKLGAAGMKTPTTVLFYEDHGILVARGSEEQLALVHRLVLELNGFSPKEVEASNSQFIKEIADVGFENIPTAPMTNLFSRHFKVNPNIFTAALRKATGMQTDDIPTMARSLFRVFGVNLDLPGKSVFYGDRLGELFVRATKQDLDTIERVMEAVSDVAPQIHIKARFLEVPKGTLAGLKNVISSTNQLVQTNQVAGLVGIFTDANFRTVLHSLEALPGAETLAEPEVVTTSGRQTQMRATTEVEGEDVVYDVIVKKLKPLEIGPIWDVVPYVLSDGYTINLTLIPSLTELLVSSNSAPKNLPDFRVRQVVTTLNLWDNQTAVISGLPEKDYVSGKEVLDKTKASDKELLVFVTATIVDQVGNQVHSDDELPFAQKSAPRQPSQPK